VLDVDVDGWHATQLVKVPVPPEPAGATTCVVAGGLPWYDVQVTVASTTSFRCVAVTAVVVVAGWQFAQAGSCWCGRTGGLPWHDAHVTVASTIPFRWSAVGAVVAV
jgi:hypothetical protein